MFNNFISEIEVNSNRIFYRKPLFTEIEENYCISIYKLGDSTTQHNTTLHDTIRHETTQHIQEK